MQINESRVVAAFRLRHAQAEACGYLKKILLIPCFAGLILLILSKFFGFKSRIYRQQLVDVLKIRA